MKKAEKNIILIGFMASGKSTLGKKLANKLEFDFIDTDDLIEKSEQISINEIFETKGEDYFRLLEKKLIEKLPNENTVIAVGGGLPCYSDNMKSLNSKGCTVYLKRPAKELFNRLLNAKNKRPLVKNLSEDELLLFIEKKLKGREVFYEQSQIILERNEQTVKDIVKKIAPEKL